MEKIRMHKDLRVYQLSFEAAMEIFELSKNFPNSETYSLTNQIRRSSRSVSGNIAEGFRKRRYPKAFALKLSDAEGEAAETQDWLEYAKSCQYLTFQESNSISEKYDQIIGMLVNMIKEPEKWSW